MKEYRVCAIMETSPPSVFHNDWGQRVDHARAVAERIRDADVAAKVTVESRRQTVYSDLDEMEGSK